MRTRYRVTAAAVLVALAATALALVAGSVKSGSGSLGASEHKGLAFVKRNVDVFAKKRGGESPASYADQMASLNAYPGVSITPDEIATAQAAGASLNKKGIGKGKNSTSTWFSLGPSEAVYPAITNRSGSRYTASGRITALAIKPDCSNRSCTVWVGAAGGGIWRTDKGLSGSPSWTNVSDGSFASGAIGALTYDAASHTLYAGTGEDAAAGDAEAGVGIYKSSDDGVHWSSLGGNASFMNRSVRQIAVSGDTIYVASGRGVHGISATVAGPVSNNPSAPGVGVWKSTNGGATFTLLDPTTVTVGSGATAVTFPSSFGSSRGATDVAFDPTHARVVYASAYNVGVWRSIDDGATWTQIKTGQNTGAWRSEFALATVDGHTRMYESEGDTGPDAQQPPSTFSVGDAVESGTPTFDLKTSSSTASPYYATYNFCTGQCWYDEEVVSPPEDPNIVYLLGSYTYGEDLGSGGDGLSNSRAVLLSRDGGEHWTDMTQDGASPTTPNGLHPDEHALVTVPGKPLQFFQGSDGGLMRSDGTLVDTSSRCDSRHLSGDDLSQCKSLLSAVPGAYTDLNKGLQTLQFQHLSVNPANAKNVQGGTQDNGTFETSGSAVVWPQTVGGDGGMSGFDASNAKFRFHTYYDQQVDVSFASGDPRSWDWIADPLFTGEVQYSLFYMPIISDPVVSGSMFAGITWIWRTQDNGGPQAYLDQHCNEFTGDFSVTCGDWVKIGGATYGGDNYATGSPTFGPGSRRGGLISWVQRSAADTDTLWASTTLGRLFVSHNANAANPSDVVLTRVDNLDGGSSLPGRAVSSIYVDPTNPDHAWVSYLGYDQATPTTTGHVFSVTYDPDTSSVQVQPLSYDIGNQPVNAVVENTNGDLYAATDFGVYTLPSGGSAWAPAANGLPVVTVASLTINPAAHQLLAATHGRGAYQLTLP